MAENISFKERVKNTAILEANAYQKMYVENTYLIFSTQFKNSEYYILSAEQDNYLHLIGVNTDLSAKDFFKRCQLGTLKEDDFDFVKPHHDEKSVKGSVRRKINCLPKLKSLFYSSCLLFEEDFRKTAMDYIMFQKGIDTKDFGERLLNKAMYSSKVEADDKTVTISMEKGGTRSEKD